MFCKNCGNKLNKDEKFCSKCGNKIEPNNTQFTTYENKIRAILSFILSLILFFISLVIYAIIIDSISSTNSTNESVGMLMLTLMCCFIPFVMTFGMSAILSINSIKRFSVGKKLGLQINDGRIILNFFNKVHLIISVLMLISIILKLLVKFI